MALTADLLPFAAAAIAIALVTVLCFIVERRRRVQFEVRFPLISDEEFLARCDPGTSPHVALRVRRIVADSLGVEYDRIHPSSSFVDDLGAD